MTSTADRPASFSKGLLLLVALVVGSVFAAVGLVRLLQERKFMKKVEAIIRHHRLEDVKNALAETGVTGMTVSEAKGFGRQRGQKEMYRGVEYTVDFVPKVRIELIVQEHECSKAVDAIVTAARTGKVGDGKIFVSDLAEVIRIRTGEVNREAI